MKVEIINKEEAKKLFENWGNTSKICYDSDPKNPSKLGKGCMKTGHYSGSRGDFIKFEITEVPRFTVDQIVRSEVGVFKNVQSFRYVDKNGLNCEYPKWIEDDERMMNLYQQYVDTAQLMYTEIQEYVLEHGGTKEEANESARYVLPMSTHSGVSIGFTIEALIHFMNMRLCVRAEDKIRQVAILMKNEVLKILPELEDYLVPNCMAKLYCPEGKRGCGAYPSREELEKIIAKGKESVE